MVTGAAASICWPAWTRACSRMGLDYVDIYYHHRMDPNTPLEETMGALATRPCSSGKATLRGPVQLQRRNAGKGHGHPE